MRDSGTWFLVLVAVCIIGPYALGVRPKTRSDWAERDALDCFVFGLSQSCRLAVVLRGTRPTKWTVEGFSDGRWTPESETGLFLQPFWRPRRLEYRQNRFLDAGSPEFVARFRQAVASSYRKRG